MNRVFVTDGQPRTALMITRSLGRKGIEVYAGEKTRFAPTLFSKYCQKAFVYPDPHAFPEQYFNWLVKTVQEQNCSVLFPMDDATLEVVMPRRKEMEKHCRMALPPDNSYRITADKKLSYLAAVEAGLACPYTVTDIDLDRLEETAETLEYPVIIKPRKSAGSRGITYVENKSELPGKYRQVHHVYPYPMIQRYIPPAAKYSVCLLFDKSSNLKASFIQKQLRHYPVDMGTSVIQESVYYPALIEEAMRLMKRLPWVGVMEMEFLVDKAGKPYFMEINPRFWASVQMAILAGVDFPWLLYNLILDNEVEEVHTYTAGLRCRWLLPGDILHFLADKRRWQMDPPFLAGRRHNVHDDIMTWDDPMPTVGFILASIRYMFSRKMWKLLLRRM